MRGRTIPLHHPPVLAIALDQPCHLLPRQASHAYKIAQHHAFVGPRQRGIAESLQHSLNESIVFRLGHRQRQVRRPS